MSPNDQRAHGSLKMRPFLKVCCISSVEEAQLAVSFGADAVGLVSDMPSGPGVIDDALIEEIITAVPPPVATFLLSSREDAGGLAEHVATTKAGVLQIVRHIDPEHYADLRERIPSTKLVQVVHVEDEGSVDLAVAYAELADALLLDSGRPGGAEEELGGTGRTHNWELSAEIVKRSGKPVFLAGGLSPENVREAVEMVAPHGIDLCSGLRTNGSLDRNKLEAFTIALW